MRARTIPQNRLFHAMVRDVAQAIPLAPWRRALATEAWKRYFIALYVREARMEAYGAGSPDPFPVRPVPSSGLDSWQMGELIASTDAWMAWNGIEWSEKTQRIEREL
ncbi:MAG TPA: recombination protein NinB [Oxalicibacterium sp.]|nr:recombination protein NinB [Oxalicibacterium sp.]